MSEYYDWRRAEPRKKTRQIQVGSVKVGGGAPISVQSMTNTLTQDVQGTIAQIRELEAAGVDIVRVSCPDAASTRALASIVRAVSVPVVADIHFHYKRAIEAAEAGAACVRINPGNIGARTRVLDIIKALKDNACSMRIGVNAGSLEPRLLEKYKGPCPEAMVESAMDQVRLLQDLDFHAFKISAKASDVFLAIRTYEALSQLVDYPLHLGITEAGSLSSGSVRSSIGIGHLLYRGIGDTIRVSLSAHPVQEVKVGFEILKSLNLRQRGVKIISCPSCARQGFDVIETVRLLEERVAHITAPISVSIIGCVVNGPGEAASTDVGFTGGGAGSGMLYLNGKELHKLANANMLDKIVSLIEEKAQAYEASLQQLAQTGQEKQAMPSGEKV